MSMPRPSHAPRRGVRDNVGIYDRPAGAERGAPRALVVAAIVAAAIAALAVAARALGLL